MDAINHNFLDIINELKKEVSDLKETIKKQNESNQTALELLTKKIEKIEKEHADGKDNDDHIKEDNVEPLSIKSEGTKEKNGLLIKNIKGLLKTYSKDILGGEANQYHIKVYNGDKHNVKKDLKGVVIYLVSISTARIIMDEHSQELEKIKKEFINCRIIIGASIYGSNATPVGTNIDGIVDGCLSFFYICTTNITNSNVYPLDKNQSAFNIIKNHLIN
ncbi:hypothetical protein DFA_00463 [Cavenderia fasciculata]|uniref:Uncharacterized protein n=1 Tax=Cavenderia fasciculata TaxID=261658 RepID=F4PS04_CACFS|nr:uncharacterized protein DFA_00463 [Cavenderia fasciculata]EGG20602.1 hypothetical protein DFA_00463 [Cavenderia fasciculata]|eukprot:XP_004358452.1 hypothetical protein DFA_00463 [Cavenderia fasciculata]